jgi:hypothetical protein
MAGACSKPFVLVTEEDKSELIDNSDAANTKKQIKYAVSRMNSFALCAGVTCLDNITDLELDNFILISWLSQDISLSHPSSIMFVLAMPRSKT